MKYGLGVDVGGTNIRMAIVSETGHIEKVIKQRTNVKDSVNDLVDQIVNLYHAIGAEAYQIEGMGIGVPGPVIQKTGYVYVLSNLGLYDFNLKELVEAKLPVKVTIGNDANLAGYAEALLGEGKNDDVVQFITISTGIGGGLVIHKQIMSGKYGFAQEIGNMIVDQHSNALQNATMKSGSFESLCSGTAIVKSARENGLLVAHAGELFELAAKGNETALQIKQTWINNTAIALANMVDYIEPDVFILGGGVMLSKEYFLEELIAKTEDYIFANLKGKLRITYSKFEQDAGIVGCGLIALNN